MFLRAVMIIAVLTVGISGSAFALDEEEVVFLGASITEGFYYPSDGVFFPSYNFDKVIVGSTPDKSSGFAEVASHSPVMVTFKECAAYFDEGGDSDHPFLHQCMQDIADHAVSIGAVPVPGTTFPIDVGVGSHTQPQLDDIIEFNAWVRSWAATNGWQVMDYYEWIADGDGQLPPAYHVGDGIHPNLAGYNVVGPHVVPTLDGVGIESTSLGELKATFK